MSASIPTVAVVSAVVLAGVGVHARAHRIPDRQQQAITCPQVQSFVRRFGREQALAMALEAGVTKDEIERARRCLRKVDHDVAQ